jgi:phage terminase Nu1 subunit (DNA packaging protein)
MARKSIDEIGICPALCSQSEFANLIGITPRRVRELNTKGTLVLEGKKVLAIESLHKYLGEMRKRAQGRAGEDGIDLASERAKLTIIQRQREEIALSIDLGQVMNHADVADGWAKFASVVKSSMLGLPTQLRAALGPHITAHDGQVIDEVVRDNLSRMADELSGGSVPGASGPKDLSLDGQKAPRATKKRR